MLTCEKNYISFNFPTKFLLKLIKLNVIKKTARLCKFKLLTYGERCLEVDS